MQYHHHARQVLIKQVTIAIESFMNSAPRNVPKDWFKSDLTMPQVRMLFLLAEYPGSRMSDLAKSLGISMPSATGIADQLVHKQLIERKPDVQDRRSILCCLTDNGIDITRNLTAASRSKSAIRLEPLSTDELNQLLHAMNTAIKAITKATQHSDVTTSRIH